MSLMKHIEKLYEKYDTQFHLSTKLKKEGATIKFSTTSLVKVAGRTVRTVTKKGVLYTVIFPSNFYSKIGLDEDYTIFKCKCHGRYDVLERVFQHELVHLLLYMDELDMDTCTKGDKCDKDPHGKNFKDMAGKLFGHKL